MRRLRDTALLAVALCLTTQTSMILALTPAIASSPSLSSLAHRSAIETGFVEILTCSDAEKGLGAFCTQAIQSGDYIGEYYGEVLTQSQVQARYFGKATPTADDERWAQDRTSRQQGTTGMYVFELKQNNMFIDAEDAEKSGWCRFMNHAPDESSKCNVRAFDKLTTNAELLVYPQFYAIRDIAEGEELCYFYGAHGHLLWQEQPTKE